MTSKWFFTVWGCLFFLAGTSNVFAEVIFVDNFDDGDISDWVVTSTGYEMVGLVSSAWRSSYPRSGGWCLWNQAGGYSGRAEISRVCPEAASRSGVVISIQMKQPNSSAFEALDLFGISYRLDSSSAWVSHYWTNDQYPIYMEYLVPVEGTPGQTFEIRLSFDGSNSSEIYCVDDVALLQRFVVVGRMGPAHYRKIQEGIDAAVDGDTVVVTKGPYRENVHFKGKNILLRSSVPTYAPIAGATMIDGGMKDSAVTFAGSESSNCVLTGFTIFNGGNHDSETMEGAGINGNGAYPTIEHNRIMYNGTAFVGGGGIANCHGTIRNNLILGNWSYWYGGGLYNCNGLIHDNTIEGNITRFIGGGICVANGTVRDNRIRGNQAYWAGGAVAASQGQLRNNVVYGNQAGEAGGGLLWCDGTIRNNLILNNFASFVGGGIMASKGTVQNNTVMDNLALEGAGLFDCQGVIRDSIVWGNSTAVQIEHCTTPTYSCIENWTGGGAGNISADPQFTFGGMPESYIPSLSQVAAGQTADSPCVDVGSGPSSKYGLEILSTRTDGEPDGGAVDMGYHYTASPASPTLTSWPPLFRVAVYPGLKLPEQILEIRNSGGVGLSYQIASSPTALATCSPHGGFCAGRGALSHTVAFQTTHLVPGEHTGSLLVRSNDAWNSPLEVAFEIVVLGTGQPDLTVSAVDVGPEAPTELRPGDAVILSAFIENVGRAAAQPFWIEVWGSRTGGLTLDYALTPSRHVPAGLAVGESHSWADPGTLYPVPEGTYTVVYTVDRPGEIAEVNERDNRRVVAAKPIRVNHVQTAVDLAVEGFGISPAGFQPGETIAFTGRVTNQGTQASGPFWIEFWASMDHPYPALHFYLCDSIQVENLNPGEWVDLSDYSRAVYDWMTDIDMAGCFADRANTISEIDETNNYQFLHTAGCCATSALTAPAARQQQEHAEIVITSADFSPNAPTRVTPGDAIALTVHVANQGTSATGPFWVEYWGARDGGIVLENFVVTSDHIAGLAPGQSTTLQAAKPLSSIPDGSYTIVVVADRLDGVEESNEGNNRRPIAAKRLLTFRPTTQANLTVEDFTVIGDVLAGTIRNTGVESTGPFMVEFHVAFGDPDYPSPFRHATDSIVCSALGPGEELDLASYNRTLYSSLPAGTYVVICHADGTDQVAETDETDNYTFVRDVSIAGP